MVGIVINLQYYTTMVRTEPFCACFTADYHYSILYAGIHAREVSMYCIYIMVFRISCNKNGEDYIAFKF